MRTHENGVIGIEVVRLDEDELEITELPAKAELDAEELEMVDWEAEVEERESLATVCNAIGVAEPRKQISFAMPVTFMSS